MSNLSNIITTLRSRPETEDFTVFLIRHFSAVMKGASKDPGLVVSLADQWADNAGAIAGAAKMPLISPTDVLSGDEDLVTASAIADPAKRLAAFDEISRKRNAPNPSELSAVFDAEVARAKAITDTVERQKALDDIETRRRLAFESAGTPAALRGSAAQDRAAQAKSQAPLRT